VIGTTITNSAGLVARHLQTQITELEGTRSLFIIQTQWRDAVHPLTSIVYLGRFTTIDDNSVREARAMGETQLGRMQFRIMQVLWYRKRANAREITEALNSPQD
jgi:hypothetical protein